MLEKNMINIEIGISDIKILIGNKKIISNFRIIDTPKEAFIDDKIINVNMIAMSISEFLKKNNIKTKNVSFAIKGQDIVVRHIEIPIMDHDGIWEAVQWEVAQYLPEGGENYYSDYEIEEKINTKEKKVYKLMIVSVPKEKIDKYVELVDIMKLRLTAIDIVSNNICRVFRKVFNNKEQLDSIGVINLGLNSSSITILKNGRLFIEREVPFGIMNAATVFNDNIEMNKKNGVVEFLRDYNLDRKSENIIASNIDSLFNDMFLIFDRVIQFFSTGRAQKSLDMIYIIGEGAEIKGISNYVGNYFATKCEIINLPKQVLIDTEFPGECKFGCYINTLGLMLRKE
jgi:type IV pilus assembly protein PilM